MLIPFEVSIKLDGDKYTVGTLWDCDTEVADVGGSELASFDNEKEAFEYLKKQVEDYGETL